MVGLSLQFDWQQVFLNLRNSTKNSGWAQQCCSLGIIVILLFCEFLSAALADSFLLEIEWHQVSWSLQDYPHYSDRS